MNTAHSSDSKVVAIDDIIVEDRFRKEFKDIEKLSASIASIGLLQPIVITPELKLIAGERRLRACKSLGWSQIPCRVALPATVSDPALLLVAERDENECHSQPNNLERAKLGKAIEKLLGNRQGKRSKGNQSAESESDSLPVKRPEVKEGEETREAAARQAGFDNEKEYRNAKAINEHGSDSLKDVYLDKVVSLGDAASISREEHDIQDEAVRRVKSRTSKTLKAAAEAIKAERKHVGDLTEAVVDCNGINVPDNLREYFESIAEFEEVAVKARELRLLLNKLDKQPISQYRQRGYLQGLCGTIEQAMESERFGFVCPSCEGHDGANCNCCDNKRWFKPIDKDKVDIKKYRRKGK